VTWTRSRLTSGKTSCFTDRAISSPPTMNTIISRLAATWLWVIQRIAPFIEMVLR
jgi:hypothetical protein